MADQPLPPPPPPPPPAGGGMFQGMPPQMPPGQYPPYPPQMPPAQGPQGFQGQGMPGPYVPQGGQPMPAAGMPPGGYPQGYPQGGTPPPPPPPPKPAVPANFQLGALLPKELKIKIPAHALKFDEQYFLRLLAGSISLTKDEKARIIESVPKLSQGQVDELIRIFEEEKRKFAELSEEHVPQLQKLAQQHYEDWIDIEMQAASRDKKANENQQAEELRKKLGLN